MHPMFEYLRALGARLLGGGNFGPFQRPPDAPFASVREPRRRGPGGRSTAAAVAEPEEGIFVQATGTHKADAFQSGE